MKTKLILSLTFAVIALFTTSCKKYDDGPTFSLASKKARVDGTWKYEKVTSTSGGLTLDITAATVAITSSVEFSKDGSAKFYNVTLGSTTTGTWAFDSKKENVIVTVGSSVTTNKILRLKEKELWFSTTGAFGVVTEYHLIPA